MKAEVVTGSSYMDGPPLTGSAFRALWSVNRRERASFLTQGVEHKADIFFSLPVFSGNPV
uniref:Uncharacterized protein n=1 Tax=Paracidobacterium acidisoli TaxID=2303751 RepID=A0A372IPI5_9BACT